MLSSLAIRLVAVAYCYLIAAVAYSKAKAMVRRSEGCVEALLLKTGHDASNRPKRWWLIDKMRAFL